MHLIAECLGGYDRPVSSVTKMPARHRHPTVLTVTGACAGVVFVTLLVSGVRVSEVLLFICFQVAYALVPGLLLSVALLGGSRSLLDRLAVAWPLGLAIEIGCFVLAAAIGQRWLFAVYPAAFVIPAVPLLWRHRARLPLWSASSQRAVAPEMAIGALLVTVGASLVVFLALFAPSPLPRDIQSASYYPDLMSNLSVTTELLHHWPFMYPSVTGVALHFQIFANVEMAAAAQIAHLDVATIVMRLQPTFLIGLIAVQLYVLGHKIGGSRPAGLAALALGLFAGELNFSQINLAGGGIPVLGGLYSLSYQLGAVFFLAVLILLVDRLSSEMGGSRAHDWLALGVLSLGAAGAKPSVVPILAAGLALFVMGQAFTRRGLSVGSVRVQDVRSLAIVVVAGAVGYVLIYRGGGSQGATFKPLDFLSHTGFASLYRHASHSPLYVPVACVAAVVALCWLLAPLAGVVFVRDRWWPWRSRSSPERLLMCMLAASLVAFMLAGVPGDSEVYFVVYGFLAASVVSAAGATAVARTLRVRPVGLIRTGLAFALGVLIVILGLRAAHSSAALVPAYVFLACVVALTAARLGGSVGRSTVSVRRDALAFAALVVICLTAVSESFEQTASTIGHWLRGTPAFAASGTDVHRGITAELLEGLLWVRDHTPSSAVIAVNNHELGGDGGSRYYYYSAFSERQVFLESWEYTPQGYRYLSLEKTGCPFPGLLAINDAAVLDASPAAISLLRVRYGVRYIVIDRLHGTGSANLARFAHPIYVNPAIAVFRVQ